MLYDSSSDMFCADAKRYPILSVALTENLLSQAAAGDMQAADKLLLHNLRIAICAVNNFRCSRRIPLEDLYQEAALGVRHAIEIFRPGMGKFFSVCYTWATYYLQKATAESEFALRMSEHFMKRYMHVYRVRADYYTKHDGEEPSVEELVRLTGYGETLVKEILAYGESSMDVMCEDDEDGFFNPFAETLASVDEADDMLCLRDVEGVLEVLICDPRTLDIIKCNFGIGGTELSMKELAAKYHITEQRVRQLRQAAMRNLKANKNAFLAA